jgi:hypothetical protein
MIKKKLILLGIVVSTIILAIFIFQPHQLPRHFCISDSMCTCRLMYGSCDEHYCTNIFWRPAEESSRGCELEPEPPNYRCINFRCEETGTEYSGCLCTVDGSEYTCEEYQEIKAEEKIRKTLDFDPIKEEYVRCKCYPKEGKDKFVIFMKEDSQFYSEELRSKLDEYLDAVRSDVGIENMGILFFEGDADAFRERLHTLYLEEDVGYVMLIGNDLVQSLEELNYTDEGVALSYGGYYTLRFGESRCPSIAVSLLPFPPNSDLDEQKDFISDQIDNYIRFHEDPDSYLSGFSRSYIRIVNLDVGDYNTFDPSSPDIEPDEKYQWDLPKMDILSSDPNLKSEIMDERPMILEVMGHGWTRIMAWEVTPSYAEPPYSSLPSHMGTTDGWINFTSDFTPSLLISNTGCGGMVINDYNTTGYGGYLPEFCCWPQAFLKSGALAYMSESHPRLYDLTGSDFFGQALKKSPIGTK